MPANSRGCAQVCLPLGAQMRACEEAERGVGAPQATEPECGGGAPRYLGSLARDGDGRGGPPVGRHRVVAAMGVAGAGLALLLDVRDFAAVGHLAIAPEHATAGECGKPEKTHETHGTFVLSDRF